MVPNLFPKHPSSSGASDRDCPRRGLSFVHGSNPARPIDLVKPAVPTTPVIFTSPHSGRLYPVELLSRARLGEHELRQSEDSYVDLLFADVPRAGAPLLKANFPRAYVDVNRSPDELDPRMFTGAVNRPVDCHSTRVRAGLGVVPRIVADGQNIYARKIPIDEITHRIEACYKPYHRALRSLIDETKSRFGMAIVIDCHSMPSAGGRPLRHGDRPIDFVLGDRFGAACAACVPALFEDTLRREGFHVTRNNPYAGGYVAQKYGRPERQVHVLQIEINRALYLDEARITRNEGYDRLKPVIGKLIAAITEIDPESLRSFIEIRAQAAE